MRLKHLLLTALIIPSIIHAQEFFKPGYFLIKGRVKNCKEPFFEFGTTTYLASTHSSIMLQKDGSFEKKVPVQNQQNLSLSLGEELLIITVLDKDTLYLNWDATDFEKSFTIKGKNDIRTKELQFQAKHHSTFFPYFMNLNRDLHENAKTLSAEDKFTLINNLYNQQIKTILDSAGFFSPTLNDFITDLYFRYTQLLHNNKLLPQYKLKLTLDSTKSYPYLDLSRPGADYRQLNEEWFKHAPEYRDFIYNYVRFHTSFTSWHSLSTGSTLPFNPTLSAYHLAKANINLLTIQDWFITQAIIDGFGDYSFENVEKVYRQYINTCKTLYYKDTLQKYYTAVKRLKPGSPAPGFTLKNDKGQIVSLSEFKGKIIYIDFWGTKCGPCLYDIKNHIPNLHKKYKNKDVIFISICVDANEKDWKEALLKYKLDGVNLFAEGWTSHPVCKAYNVTGIPHYILIDKKGNIADNNAPRAPEINAIQDKNKIDLLLH